MLRICDLFCGTGGFSVAFEKFDRYKSVIANDIEPSSQKIYEENCKGKFILKDINTFTNEEINLLPDFDGRRFEIIERLAYKPKIIKTYFETNGIKQANITTRNFRETPKILKNDSN